MQFLIDPRAARPIYVQIMDEVRRLIVTGELRPDDPLPSVRQLAADLRVNHNTIVQAYRELEREEGHDPIRGDPFQLSGRFVAEQDEPAACAGFAGRGRDRNAQGDPTRRPRQVAGDRGRR